MAKEIDLESQEQIDALKHFWDRYGTLITAAVVLVAVVFFGMDWYRKYQDRQAVQASVLYGQMQLAADAGESDKVERVLADMQKRYADTTYTEQGAFLAASVLAADGENDKAQQAVQWVLDNSSNTGYRAVARLRLSALAVARDDLEGALQLLNDSFPAGFAALADDRRGDVLNLQGKTGEAVTAYQAAYREMDKKLGYREVVGIKLTALGADPEGTDEQAAADTGDTPDAKASQSEASADESSKTEASEGDSSKVEASESEHVGERDDTMSAQPEGGQ